jgi:hypothetical protein
MALWSGASRSLEDLRQPNAASYALMNRRSFLQSALAGTAARREEFLRDANADFAALRRNSKAWAEELAERQIWEQTLGDGIER